MHIRDGILSNEVCLAAGVCAAGAIGYSVWRLRHDKQPRPLADIGAVAALVFAGQMMNFPIPGLAASGHLIGGVLAAAWLGPWAGCLAITAVLVVQAIVFADGGVVALGVNVLNMAVIGAWGGAAITRWLERRGGGRVASIAVAAWATVILAATAFCLEFGASWQVTGEELGSLFTLMLGYHALIGIGEAGLTIGGLTMLTGMASWAQASGGASPPGWRRFVVSGLLVACVIAGLCSPWASPFPDGLEAVGERMAFHDRGIDRALVLSDYAIPLPGSWESLSIPLAGVMGTLLTFVAAAGVTYPWSRMRPARAACPLP
jgi:cobalt/nickel transport system permease protein